ncbi:mechanosensitive ion channel protein 2, chloroplastic-like isoform X2 [Andrographis paniculata]|uniref:mechanosensitive ion channel protein 2, chloroplastic-like isoform X2 n=1 Tax=Andrographis paniculata TaxID=175694 RepID=UPI0021E95E2F|nr:mechanosensitive ion channel protein 2, chloroplastic-like isoform X2 [Andrographis paniculata]
MSGSLQLSLEIGISKNDWRSKRLRLHNSKTSGKLCLLRNNLPSISLKQYSWSSGFPKRIWHRTSTSVCKNHQFRCHCFLQPGPVLDPNYIKNTAQTLARSFNSIQGNPVVIKLASALGIVIFAIWGLGPVVKISRNILLQKNDGNWKRSCAYLVATSYIQPLLLWMGAIIICRTLDPMSLPTEGGQIVKQRLLTFVRSLSTLLAFAYCLLSVIQQLQTHLMVTYGSSDARNMGFQFATKGVYTVVWIAAVSLFMELLGFSTQRWLTAGGLGTVLLTLAGREIFTNFLSSAMIHATRPFIINEWIQTKIEGYEVSGTVESVGWWGPAIIRGEDREAVHIPSHKFTMNVVRNLSQKTHWRIKSYIAINHLDVRKINNIVADMRKVLAKNPQVEHKKLHRRVFFESINPENQALTILISCFVKTSHMEEYLCVKEAILLDLLRVVKHHQARLATPIRTVQKILNDTEVDNVPFSDSMYDQGAASSRPLLLMEPIAVKANGEEKTKSQSRPVRAAGEEDNKTPTKSPPPDNTVKEIQTPDAKVESEKTGVSKIKTVEDYKVAAKSSSSPAQLSKIKTVEDYIVAAESSSSPAQLSKIKTVEDYIVAAEFSSSTELGNSPKTVEKVEVESIEESCSNVGVASGPTQSPFDSKNSQKAVEETATQTAASSPDSAVRRSTNTSSASSHPKQDGKQSTAMGSKPSLEENIVLGVALEGSKRTLPIDDEETTLAIKEEIEEDGHIAKQQ